MTITDAALENPIPDFFLPYLEEYAKHVAGEGLDRRVELYPVTESTVVRAAQILNAKGYRINVVLRFGELWADVLCPGSNADGWYDRHCEILAQPNS